MTSSRGAPSPASISAQIAGNGPYSAPPTIVARHLGIVTSGDEYGSEQSSK